MNTLSEIEGYYKKRERRLIEKAPSNRKPLLPQRSRTLKQLTENQKAPVDETDRAACCTGAEAFKEELYRDPLTGAYNRRYYEEVVRKIHRPGGCRTAGCGRFQDLQRYLWASCRRYGAENGGKRHSIPHPEVGPAHPLRRGRVSAGACPAYREIFCSTKLEQIRTAVQMASVPGYSHFRISLSIGGTIQSITDPMENIVRRADRLMYQAKCRKNAVMVEVPGQEPGRTGNDFCRKNHRSCLWTTPK